ncbi:NUDIX domain-containing protein [Kineosporia rhizophila]|uniref:NUDIX hydrolase n=1 Tax=Kineosporia rhizophila TaxID=84633 RepID=UPI001E625E0D|nr:NUDIX domain-containing protein [Kineosporia rhizophila]
MDVDAQLLHRARLLLAGELEPVLPRAAATVALIRDTPDGLQVYLLRRQPRMAFAAGMYVFPGGSVDASDSSVELETSVTGWVGPAPSVWAGWFGTDEVTAASLVRAAVRETFEEAGVLLASSMNSEATTASLTETERADLEAGRISLSGLLARHHLALRADRLAPLQHWITPEPEQRRYDTWFFVAALPEGQEPREAGTEADRRVWLSPAQALDAGLTLMPPTRAALTELARHGTVAEALQALVAEREIETVTPRFEIVGDRVAFFRD